MTAFAVTGTGCVSRAGPGVTALREAVDGDGAGTLADFDARRHLRMRGLRPLSRASGLAAVAAAEALGRERALEPADERCAVVLGTLWGSIDPLVEFERVAVLEGPEMVSPSQFPNVVVNVHAGYLGILFGLAGPNVTLCGPGAGLEAVGHARDLLTLGRADVVLCGGVDDASPAVLAAAPGEAPGEGAGLLMLAREGEEGAHALLTGWASVRASAGDLRAARAAALALALADAGVGAHDVAVAWHGDAPAPEGCGLPAGSERALVATTGACRAAGGALAAVLAAADARDGQIAIATAFPAEGEQVIAVFEGSRNMRRA